MEAEATRGAICCRCHGHAGGDGGVPYKARVYARREVMRNRAVVRHSPAHKRSCL